MHEFRDLRASKKGIGIPARLVGRAGKSNPVNVALGRSLVTCQHIVRGRRKWVFRSKPIVRDKRPRARSRCNMPDKMAVCFGGAKGKPTTVQVDDRLA